MLTTFHLGESEHANRSIGQVLWTLIHPDQKDWVEKLPITEFVINLSLSSLTGFAPFKLNYGYMPTIIGGISPIEHTKPGVKRFINQAISNLEMAIIESQVTQTWQENKWWRPETPFAIRDKVYLSTENLALPLGRSCKLMPKYIGPYKVTKTHPKESRYTLELPPELAVQKIHPSFHVSRLQHYEKNDNVCFPKHKVCTYYDFGDTKDNE